MSKVKKQKEARILRKKGLSLGKIAMELKVSKGSVSRWCENIILTKDQEINLHQQMVRGSYLGRMIGVQIQKDRKKKTIEGCLDKAKRDILKLKRNELFLSGLSLYWGEGAKSGSNVRFYNSDALVIKFVMEWFRKSLHIENSRFMMYVNINKAHKNRLKDITKYWSEITDIPIDQFRKPTLIKVKNIKEYENFSEHYGTLSIRISKSKNLLYQILAWIKVLSMAV